MQAQLTKTGGQAKIFLWNEEAQRAFEELKRALLTEPILPYKILIGNL